MNVISAKDNERERLYNIKISQLHEKEDEFKF